MKIRYDELMKRESQRPLSNIETRMKEQVERQMKYDNVTWEEIRDIKKWSLKGNIEQLMRQIEGQVSYDFPYRVGSVHIHGEWHDLDVYHLRREVDGYIPRTDYWDPDTRYLNPLTIIMLEHFSEFLQWNNSDPKQILRPLMIKVLDIAKRLDAEQETFFQQGYNKAFKDT